MLFPVVIVVSVDKSVCGGLLVRGDRRAMSDGHRGRDDDDCRFWSNLTTVTVSKYIWDVEGF